jgi:hypothetical protein
MAEIERSLLGNTRAKPFALSETIPLVEGSTEWGNSSAGRVKWNASSDE